jgi:hypothetical protein
VDRAAALRYLSDRYETLAAVLDVDEVSAERGYLLAIDDALRALGVAEGDLPTAAASATDRDDFLALARYHTLTWFADGVVGHVDLDLMVAGVKKARSQLPKQLAERLKQATDEVQARGLLATGRATSGRLGLDIFEPAIWGR